MHKKGLTLVEILVASIILAFILIGLANIFVVGKKYTLHSRSRIQVAEIGKYFLEPLQMQIRQDNWGANCLSSNPTAGCVIAGMPIDNITYTPTWTIDAVAGTDLRRVVVAISWTEPD